MAYRGREARDPWGSRGYYEEPYRDRRYDSDRRDHHHQRRRWSTSSDGNRSRGGNPCQSCGNAISSRMERAFYWVGKKVATNPVIFMVGSVIIAGALGSGIIFLEEENRQEKLWLPSGSPGEEAFELVQQYFPSTIRLERLVVADSNVLRADVIKAMFELNKKISTLNQDKESSWESVCIKLGNKCWINSLLEIWNFDETEISGLTDASVLEDINTVTTSPYSGGMLVVANILGGVVKDDNGRIVSATSTVMSFFAANNETEVDGKMIYLQHALDFEKEFVNLLLEGQDGIDKLYFYAQRSYDDVFSQRTNSEARTLLGVGYGLMAIFVVLVIGKFNRLEHRVYLTGGGMLSVGLSLLVAMGLGTYMGFFYGPIQNILALLLLGVGVDDMFVITHALDRLPESVLKEESPIRQIALALRHAGVSITVTSVTDVIAFAVGASTILPALRSFCVYCAIGLLAMYMLLLTFFIGCLAIDRKRVYQYRDACCCVLLDWDWKPTEWSRKSLMSWFFKRFYGGIITHPVTKVIVILVAAGLVSGAGYGLYHLEVKTDFVRLFPSGTYPREYLEFVLEEYPTDGSQTSVFLIDVDYYGQKSVLDKLHTELDSHFHIRNGSVSSWYLDFKGWFQTPGTIANNLLTTSNDETFPKDEDTFYILLDQFLTSAGARHMGSSVIAYTNANNKMRVNASRINMEHANIHTTALEIRALEELRDITAGTGLGQEHCFPYGLRYPAVAANRVIREELFRNLGLAFACVAVVTLPLIASIVTCILVCITVVATLVDVAGGMYFLGINIDIVSSLTLILTIGLSVDYSAHVGNTFMTVTGTRNERVRATLETIGAPVFLGGFSTFLALSPLLFASSFVLHTFFTLFTAIVVVGLFHGLALLPVLLSLVGPAPYASAYRNEQHSDSFNHRPKLDEPRQDDMDRGWRERNPPKLREHNRHSYDRYPSKRDSDRQRIWHTDSSGEGKHNGHKKRLFYYDPRYERPVPLYNGRPAVRPPSNHDFIGHSVRRSYNERDRHRHNY